MPWDHDGLGARGGDIGRSRPNLAIDAAAGGIVDERIDPVPEGVRSVEDIGLTKGNGDIAIGMCRTVVLQKNVRVVQPQFVLGSEYFGGQCSHRCRGESIFPSLYPGCDEHVLARILVRHDCRARIIQPGVAVGVIGVPADAGWDRR